MKKTIFWNVDTQKDFMNANGALYVPDAELIKPKLKDLTNYAFENRMKVLGSVDAHEEKDEEMQANGGPFPFHCMNETEGQKHIIETAPRNAVYVLNLKLAEKGIEKIVKHPGEVIFEKQHYDVFTNPNVEPILRELGVEKAVVYGVATDYCDKAAAIGLRNLGIEVLLVEDAIKPVTEKGGIVALKEMRTAGVTPATVEQILRGK